MSRANQSVDGDLFGGCVKGREGGFRVGTGSRPGRWPPRRPPVGTRPRTARASGGTSGGGGGTEDLRGAGLGKEVTGWTTVVTKLYIASCHLSRAHLLGTVWPGDPCCVGGSTLRLPPQKKESHKVVPSVEINARESLATNVRETGGGGDRENRGCGHQYLISGAQGGGGPPPRWRPAPSRCPTARGARTPGPGARGG